MKRILIVAPDSAIRSLMAIFVEHLGHQVYLAADLDGGIIAARCWAPDIILLVSHPLCLPARAFLDTYAVACRHADGHPPARVAVLSTNLTDELLDSPPVSGSLRMPFTLEELEGLIWTLAQTLNGRSSSVVAGC